MTDYERHAPPLIHHDHDRGAQVRTVIQGLILAGIVGLVGMVIQQGRDQAQADRERSMQIATLQAQVANLQTMLAGVADLKQRMTRVEANQAEHDRRIVRLEDGSDKAQRWTR